MLSLWKLRVGAESYYLSQVAHGLDDYYTGRGEMPGRWLGNAASGLELDGAVASSDLRAVLAGLQPGTGLSPNGDRLRTFRGRVPGFDLTFSAPKSVSVMYALADPLVRGQIVNALDAAVDEAIGWLEREACFVRRGSNNRERFRGDVADFGTRRVPGDGFVAAAFRHRTSRAGDPQLHSHVLVANLAKGPDGRWSALDGQAVYRSRRAAGAVYDAAVRAELARRLGVDWLLNQRGDGEIAGIPRRVLRLFSKRRNEIEDELERIGAAGPLAAAAATLKTRKGAPAVDGEGLDARWIAEAAAVGYGPDDIDTLLTFAGQRPVQARPEDTVMVAVKDSDSGMLVEQRLTLDELGSAVAAAVAAKDSSCTRHQVTMAIAQLLRNGASTAALQRLTDVVLGQHHFIPLPAADGADAGFEERWTSRHLLAVETELLAALAPTPGRVGVVDPDVTEAVLAAPQWASLGADQVDLVRRVTSQGLGVEVVIGRAGTGKTHAMAAVRAVLERAGHRLVGVAPSALAARGLSEGGGFEAFTFPRFHRHRAAHLGLTDVVVIDEAGMAGTVDLHRTVTTARACGAKVILVGDHRQLPEITAGGGFAAAITALGDRVAELTVNRRQQQNWEIAALDQLRHGDVPTAFAAYRTHGRVTVADDSDQLHRVVLADWWAAYRTGRDALLLAGTRAEANALNRDGRAIAAANGRLTGVGLEVDGKVFQCGDRVICLRNDADGYDHDTRTRCRIDNGMIATITHIHPGARVVDVRLTNGRRLRLSGDYVDSGGIDHGYAATIHKAQGVTCDDVFVVGPRGLYRQAGYVAMSRARHGARIYATGRDAATLGERPHTTGIPLPSEPVHSPETDLLDALQRSQAKQLASSLRPHLTAIADAATRHPLDALWRRHQHCQTSIRELERAGYRNPTVERERLERARTHRQFLSTGGRVRALDWDNVGTVQAVVDVTGTCLIRFDTAEGRRSARKVFDWADVKPIDHPDPVALSDDADDFFALWDAAIGEDTAAWNTALAGRGIGQDEPVIVAAAVEHRQRQCAHRLAGQQPDWITWWYGPRPADPAGAQVWDDEIAAVAAWRDARHLDDHTAGYGPQPHLPQLQQRWREHLQRSLHVRHWLQHHQPHLTIRPQRELTATEIRERLAELDAILATAPADQSRILDDLRHRNNAAADTDAAIHAALITQGERADWILEHWPHVIEHAELTALAATHGPLDHWPVPLPPAAQAVYDRLAAASVDTPEQRAIGELNTAIAANDPRQQLARLQAELRAVSEQLGRLDRERGAIAGRADFVAVVDDHRHELVGQYRGLECDIRHARAGISLYQWGTRTDHELHAARARRANHLAHTAIANGDEWVIETVRSWVSHHPEPGAKFDQLSTLVSAIAAHREQHAVSDAHPLGPAPVAEDARLAWQRLQDQLIGSDAVAPLLTTATPGLI